jgi:hypothetical protein
VTDSIEAPGQWGDPLSGLLQAMERRSNADSAQITQFSSGVTTVRLLAKLAQIGSARVISASVSHSA